MKRKIVFFIVAVIGIYIFIQQNQVRVTEKLKGVGNGAKAGQTVVFDYQGFLYDSNAQNNFGKLFDSTYRRHSPMRAQLGSNQLIQGLEKALIGMQVGAQRKVVIAPAKAYGENGAGNGLVPPNATVVYQIELRSIE